MIEITHLRKIYKTYGQGNKEVVALEDISLAVPQGEIFGVLGQSGAGKSTLIRCINLLERPTSGRVVVNQQDMTALSGRELRKARQGIGMIFQQFNLLNSRTVLENVTFPLEVIGQSRSQRRKRALELLDLVGLANRAGAYPAQLSGGQKQRVGIARALAASPDVLLSDEATSALDPQTTSSILELLRDLNKRMGLTILLITHEMNVVRQICDQVAIIEAGHIVEQGRVTELAALPESRLAQSFFPHVSNLPMHEHGTVVTISFSGSNANEPVFSELVRQFQLDVNILSGSIETISGQRLGQLQAELVGTRTQDALAYLRERGLRVEVEA